MEECEVEKVLLRPGDLVRACFLQGDGRGSLADAYGARNALDSMLQNADFYQQIPLLEPEALRKGLIPPSSLVRYRGMVQDILDVEFFVSSYIQETGIGSTEEHLTAFSDTIEFDCSSTASATSSERTPVFCVPVPGETEWARGFSTPSYTKPAVKSAANSDDGTRRKRARSFGNGWALEASDDVVVSKRALAAEPHASYEPMQTEQEIDGDKWRSTLDCCLGPQPYLKEINKWGCCLVKVYGVCKLRLGDVIDAVGIYTCDPFTQCDSLQGEEFSSEHLEIEHSPLFSRAEILARNPPPSVIPRLHIITFRKLTAGCPLYLKKTEEPSGLLSSPAQHLVCTRAGEWFQTHCLEDEKRSALEAILTPPLTQRASLLRLRGVVVDILAGALRGDLIAAEYVLLGLLSRVSRRTEDIVVGSVFVNLVSDEGSAAPAIRLVECCRRILPRVVHQSVTVEHLNSAAYVPTKDYIRNRLLPSFLQLQAGTLLVLDETTLEEGALDSRGVRSLQTLRRFASEQTLPLDFEYYTTNLPVDVPVISMSCGEPLVGGGLILPLQPSATETQTTVSLWMQEEELLKLRLALAIMRAIEADMSPQLSGMVQEDFVRARNEECDGSVPVVGPRDLHTWLTLVRLIARSTGDEHVRPEHWERMRCLEAKRMERLQQRARRRSSQVQRGGGSSPVSVCEATR